MSGHHGECADQLGEGDGPRVKVWTIRELLHNERLRIPDYQRPYAWSARNVAELVDDIRQFTPSGDYRIGTVILHGHGGVLEDRELPRDLARAGRGQSEHGHERADAENGAEHGQDGAARSLHDPGDRLGGRVPRRQPRRRQASG